MPLCFLTRVERFSACHRLHSVQLGDQENQVTFGKCNNANGHGHNYKLEVTLFGPTDPVTGMVINLSDLKSIIQRHVLDILDHKNLDKDVEYFRDKQVVSTTENLAVFIWQQLATALPGNLLNEVKLWETESNYVTYKGQEK
ncbi:6-pyruvoyl tetrahydrobiopterin synthase [Clonorchis sinensis]|uniref:6-pyruvoyl tetrahydrobiopterin synthase n=2 Tax=Clonorchis sinensis TaxID=79923 RepID=A0A8T1MMQ6_CLOSI|nr:6-pyruvoyl tetrahydrobiopterin synthase [Clonorchis sinensis]GAA50044.1 6-pyruvoyl tetrahydrobiopterin synthase [Clonorchis sinensis]